MRFRRFLMAPALMAASLLAYLWGLNLFRAPFQAPLVWPRPYSCPPLVPGEEAFLLRVVDGDTILVQVNGRVAEVRYIGVDTPEPWEPGHEEATLLNAQYLQAGPLRLYRDRMNVDHLGRLLRYVFSGPIFVNEALAYSGWAEVIPTPLNTACQARFRAAQDEARRAGRGLWRSGG